MENLTVAAQLRAIRRALISVYDKTGVVEFARALHEEFGIEIISTGGTAKALAEAGIPVTLVESLTGFGEMLDGRVKTLHPAIHAAILADRDNPEHMRQLEAAGIKPIDMVVVNLYPFEKTVADPNCTFEQAIEMIDIGGVALLRAAAKNHKHVYVLNTLLQRTQTLSYLQKRDEGWDEESEAKWRGERAWETLWLVSQYDGAIARWLSQRPELGHFTMNLRAMHLEGVDALRYGENPHQPAEALEPPGLKGRLFRRPPTTENGALSYNNYLDANAALVLCAEMTRASRSAKLRFAPIRQETAHRRNLPHWQVPGATYWITFASRIGELVPEERTIALDALRHWDGIKLDLNAVAVMPDHVHALLTPRELDEQPGAYHNLSALLKSIKGFSGREISRKRGGIGQTWVHESYDHWIRDEAEFREKWFYLTENIVKERLAQRPDEYPWWYAVDYFGAGWGVRLPSRGRIPIVLGGKSQDLGIRTEPRGEETKAELSSTAGKAELSSTAGKAELSSTAGKAELCTTSGSAACCFIKHTNPCGASVAGEPLEAYRRAYLADPNAAMGGILACNFEINAEFATAVMETHARWGKNAGAGGFFLEVWLAPAFDDAAVEVIRKSKKWGENVRLLAVGDMSAEPDANEMEYRSIAGGMLAQTPDVIGLNEGQWKVITKRAPTDAELADLRLAWLIAKHTKSNAISIVRDGMLIGNGAGQMSRVMSCRIATWLARENGHADKLPGSVAASDAFFPFRDGPDLLIEAGVSAIIQPGGSKRDAETIAACDERGVAMIFTGTRHFRH